MIFPEDFFRWLVIFFVRPQRQKVPLFVSRLFKQEKIGKALTRIALAVALSTLPAGLSSADQPREQDFNIPQQSVQTALDSLATQANVFLLFPFDQVIAIDANAVQGTYSIQQALDILLQNTGLTGDLTEGGVIAISRAGAIASATENNGKGKRMNTNKRKTLLATFVALFASGATVQANAQNNFGEQASSQTTLDEIIVTAQKREENLQDTALAVTAITGDALQARGIDSGLELQQSVPGLTITHNATGSPGITIRGIGMDDHTLGGNPGVPIHIDGHYIQASSYILRDFLDVERVEVLRGPQGTLYGRNAVGGSINIISKRPTEDFEASLGVDVGNYNKRLFQTVISGPFTDKLRGRLAVSDEKRDGFVENISSLGGDDRDDSDYTSIRGMLEYDFTEDIQLTLGAYHFDDSGSVVNMRRINEFPAVGETGPFINYWVLNNAGSNITVSDPWKLRANGIRDDSNEAKGVSLDMDWELGNILFRSLSAYNDNELNAKNSDLDGSDVVTNLHFSSNKGYETFSQEFQLLSNSESSLTWILGFYYYTENAFYRERNESDNFFVVGAPKTSGAISTDLESRALGVFGQIEYSISDKIELVSGLRYSKDKTTSFSTFLWPIFGIEGPNGEPVVQNDDSDEWTEVTGKIGVNYHIDDEVMIYASYSTGYKSGGYNVLQATPYDQETVEAYELGLKSSWFDQKIQANVDAFYYDYKDKQEFGRTAQGFSEVINAGKATVSGVELEVSSRPISGLLIDASVGYLSAEYDEFLSRDDLNFALGFQDLAGNKLIRAPEWKLSLGLQYEWEIGGLGQLMARVDTSWIDKQFGRPFNHPDFDEIDSYNRTNAQMHWDSQDELWEATLYVQNLTDEDTIDNKGGSGVLLGSPIFALYLPPRTYGVRITRRF